jgi:hypothetical protein
VVHLAIDLLESVQAQCLAHVTIIY